jgi:hypothetical protein
LPGSLTATFSLPGHQSRHVAVVVSGRQVVVALICVAVVVALLAGPVLAEALLDVASKAGEKAAPGAFFLGLGVLLIGLVARVQIMDIVGACLIGAVLLAVILHYYLMPAAYLRIRAGEIRAGAIARGHGKAPADGELTAAYEPSAQLGLQGPSLRQP